MSKYKLRDKVLIEGDVTKIEGPENTIYRVVFNNGGYNMFREKDLNVASKTYEDGLNDAWELVEKIFEMPIDEREMALSIDEHYLEDILVRLTPQEALAKIEAYEKSKQIQVGDVVRHKAHASTSSDDYIVLDAETGTSLRTDLLGVRHISFDGDWVKTGRHIDIEHLLEQIRGDQ